MPASIEFCRRPGAAPGIWGLLHVTATGSGMNDGFVTAHRLQFRAETANNALVPPRTIAIPVRPSHVGFGQTRDHIDGGSFSVGDEGPETWATTTASLASIAPNPISAAQAGRLLFQPATPKHRTQGDALGHDRKAAQPLASPTRDRSRAPKGTYLSKHTRHMQGGPDA